MLPTPSASGAFRRDQTVIFRADYWDTTLTVPQQGTGLRLFSVTDPRAVNGADLQAAVLSGAGLEDVLLGNMGVVPNLYLHWGAGAPTGVRTARRTLLHFSGQITGLGDTPVPLTLVLGGNGTVQCHLNGSLLPKARYRVGEPAPFPTWTSQADIEVSAGYQIHEVALKDGDTLDLYYLQQGETWGGIFGKAIPETGIAADWPRLREALRDAPIIGAGLLSQGPVQEVAVPALIGARVQWSDTTMSSAKIDVATAPWGEPSGFLVDTETGETHLIDNRDSSTVLKPGRRISFHAGYAELDGEETYPRFTGVIDQIIPSDSGDQATIQCSGFERLLEITPDENFPDPLAYLAHGFVDREWLGYPVFGIPAFDAWPLETALAELCYRSGVDALSLGKSLVDPNHGRRVFATHTTGRTVYGQRRFEARGMAEHSQPVLLQRQRNYGNVGMRHDERRAQDDEYLYGAEVSERLFDRASKLANQYGYDFYFDAEGQAVIGARNNPVRFVPFVTPVEG